jgi:hypothetical protein
MMGWGGGMSPRISLFWNSYAKNIAVVPATGMDQALPGCK